MESPHALDAFGVELAIDFSVEANDLAWGEAQAPELGGGDAGARHHAEREDAADPDRTNRSQPRRRHAAFKRPQFVRGADEDNAHSGDPAAQAQARLDIAALKKKRARGKLCC